MRAEAVLQRTVPGRRRKGDNMGKAGERLTKKMDSLDVEWHDIVIISRGTLRMAEAGCTVILFGWLVVVIPLLPPSIPEYGLEWQT